MSFIFNFCFIPLCNLATFLFFRYHTFSLHKCEVIHNYEIVDKSGILIVTYRWKWQFLQFLHVTWKIFSDLIICIVIIELVFLKNNDLLLLRCRKGLRRCQIWQLFITCVIIKRYFFKNHPSFIHEHIFTGMIHKLHIQ